MTYAEGTPVESLELNTLLSLTRTSDILGRYIEIETGKYGSSPIHFAVLNAISVHGGTMTPGAISKWIFRSKHAVTQVLDALERQELIRREINTSDRRSIHVILTEKGWDYVCRMVPVAREAGERILSPLGKEHLETLNSLLKQMRKQLFIQLDQQRSAIVQKPRKT